MKFLIGALGALVLAAPAQGAIADVSISGLAFNPPATTIDQGDSVRWTNNDFVQHNVTFAGAPSNPVTHAGTYVRLFPAAGTFPYLCTIHDGMTGSVTVYGPTADAQATPTTPEVGEEVTFDGTASSHNDPAGTIDSYAWAFGDGATDSGGTVGHSYAAPGIYDVELIVADGKGATATDVVRITVGPLVRISNRRVNEGDSRTRAAKFFVRLSRASTITTTVEFETRPGTARSPSDFRAKSGLVTFLPGETEKTVSVRVVGDRRNEPNEKFTVRLSSPTNATIIDARGVGTILDDD